MGYFVPSFISARSYFMAQILLYSRQDATRPAALSNFFMKMTHNSAAGFACGPRCPVLRRRILIPERPERHRATRPNYDGIYEPLRRAPGKISNLDIYLLRPRASQTGPSSAGRLCCERIFSSVATPGRTIVSQIIPQPSP